MKERVKRKPWAAGLALVGICLLVQGILRLLGCRKSEQKEGQQ